MLSMHMAEAEASKKRLSNLQDQGAQKIEKAAHQFSDALLTAVNQDVSQSYLSERQIETELRQIERLLSTNATQTEQWNTLLDRLTTELMEMGDIANWLDTLDKTATQINQVCQTLAQNKAKEQSPSAGH